LTGAVEVSYAGAMSFEVEVKYRSADHGRLRRLLLERGAAEAAPADQEDVYLSHPSRDFAQTHEAFRLRRDGGENRITYKGPRFPGPTKTREEIEITVSAGEKSFHDLTRLFDNLGFRPVAAIRKRRTMFHLTRPPHEIEIALDRVDGLGDFAEIETIVRYEDDLPAAQAAVLALAAELGLDQVEPRSYLRMVLERAEDG
jgi:adenylate cyclase, class 2